MTVTYPIAGPAANQRTRVGWPTNMTEAVNAHQTALASLQAPPTCIATRVANQSIPHGADTALVLDTQVKDTALMFAPSDSKIYAPVAGTYLVTAYVVAVGPNFMIVNIRPNGTTAVGPNGVIDASGAVRICASTHVTLAAGEYVDIAVYQSSAGSVARNATGRVSMVYAGP